ncbi:MAG: hypothetical protein K6C36_00775, partial [Clostridia bacterium]|nr:hypothetical protein [Clostridia bacterium]
AAFDLDLDGETTAFDARLALRLAIGLEDDSTVPDPFPADADGDGEVTAQDAREILRFAISGSLPDPDPTD